MKMVLFTNYTNEKFSHSWDGVPHNFPAGKAVYVEDWKAEHFAKHLVDRELNKLKLPTNHHTRQQYIDKCIGEEAGDVPESTVASELANKNMAVNSELNSPEAPEENKETTEEGDKPFCDQCDSKGGPTKQHKKECPKNPKNLATDEDKFEGLKE